MQIKPVSAQEETGVGGGGDLEGETKLHVASSPHLYIHNCFLLLHMPEINIIFFPLCLMQQELVGLRKVPNFVFLEVYFQKLVQAPHVIELDAFPSDVYF